MIFQCTLMAHGRESPLVWRAGALRLPPGPSPRITTTRRDEAAPKLSRTLLRSESIPLRKLLERPAWRVGSVSWPAIGEGRGRGGGRVSGASGRDQAAGRYHQLMRGLPGRGGDVIIGGREEGGRLFGSCLHSGVEYCKLPTPLRRDETGGLGRGGGRLHHSSLS